MSYSNSEVKSGLLIVVSVVLLFILTMYVGNFMGGETRIYTAHFGYINGLQTEAPVYYAGFEVGKVERIEIFSAERERPVALTLRISSDIVLRQDSTAYIDTLGMMGEKFLEITPGTHAAARLNEGASIEGVDPIPMFTLITKMNLLADRMDELTENLNPIAAKIDGMLDGNQEAVARIIANFEQTSANVRDMTNDLKFRPWRLVRKNS